MNKLENKIKLKAFDDIYRIKVESKLYIWSIVIFLVLLVIMLLPWTQNKRSKGNITSLNQENRTQEINSPIPGKIVKWHVKEGQFVKEGDTILQITEIKEDYLDPNLIGRTAEQVDAKIGSINSYEQKIATANSQIEALNDALYFKKEQLKNKLTQLNNKLEGEQADLEAVKNELLLANDQYQRQQKMYDEGLVSQTQLQQRNAYYQNVLAKRVVAENKIEQTKQEKNNVLIEQNSIEREYAEKISKTEGEKYQSRSQIAIGQGEMSKLKNQISNYIIRNGMYTLIAPQGGQIIRANKAGIGEIIKDGEQIVSIVPVRLDYAVEMFVRPMDLPLINVGQKVRFIFDGFPAIIFSGWPNNSYGTFGGKIIAFENAMGENGMFRILVEEDKTDKPWPTQLKIGTGVQGIALLNNVPVWYELWRNINGFPPDFYEMKTDSKIDKSAKKEK